MYKKNGAAVGTKDGADATPAPPSTSPSLSSPLGSPPPPPSPPSRSEATTHSVLQWSARGVVCLRQAQRLPLTTTAPPPIRIFPHVYGTAASVIKER